VHFFDVKFLLQDRAQKTMKCNYQINDKKVHFFDVKFPLWDRNNVHTTMQSKYQHWNKSENFQYEIKYKYLVMKSKGTKTKSMNKIIKSTAEYKRKQYFIFIDTEFASVTRTIYCSIYLPLITISISSW